MPASMVDSCQSKCISLYVSSAHNLFVALDLFVSRGVAVASNAVVS